MSLARPNRPTLFPPLFFFGAGGGGTVFFFRAGGGGTGYVFLFVALVVVLRCGLWCCMFFGKTTPAENKRFGLFSDESSRM